MRRASTCLFLCALAFSRATDNQGYAKHGKSAIFAQSICGLRAQTGLKALTRVIDAAGANACVWHVAAHPGPSKTSLNHVPNFDVCLNSFVKSRECHKQDLKQAFWDLQPLEIEAAHGMEVKAPGTRSTYLEPRRCYQILRKP